MPERSSAELRGGERRSVGVETDLSVRRWKVLYPWVCADQVFCRGSRCEVGGKMHWMGSFVEPENINLTSGWLDFGPFLDHHVAYLKLLSFRSLLFGVGKPPVFSCPYCSVSIIVTLCMQSPARSPCLLLRRHRSVKCIVKVLSTVTLPSINNLHPRVPR